jgi:Zn finger protein HypA/HybF involved in hydrogenase expression
VADGDGLPRLQPLKCERCAAPIPISLTRNECPSCGAQARIPEDYAETLKLRAQAAATLQKAERVWKRADFYNQGWLLFLVFFIGLAWLIGAIIGFFSEYSTIRPVTIFVSTILGTITFPLAFMATFGDLADLKEMFPKLPEIGKQVAQAEDISCTTCGAQARFEANALVTACNYCGSELFRVAIARRARKAASEEEESAAFSLYDSAVALQKRRRAFFQSTQIIGSTLLLIIGFAAVSLIILIILAALLALYLYLMLS